MVSQAIARRFLGGGGRRAPGHAPAALAVFLLLALLLGAFPDPAAAALNVRIAATANFGGSYQAERWVPVTISLANDGPDVTGTVVVENPNTKERYSQRVALPNRSQKVVTLYAQVPTRVSVVTAHFEAGGERVDAPQVTLLPVRQGQSLIGVIADDAIVGAEYTRALIAAYGTGTIEAVTFPPDQIPANTFGLDSFGALIVGDAATGRWSADQRAALAAWVARGGTLVVTGGANWRKATEGLGELPPLRPNNSQTVAGLGGLGGGGGPSGQWILATGDLLAGATRVAEQGGVPLVATRAWGNGTVTSLAFDPGTSAFSGWSGASTFWRRQALDTPRPNSLQEPFNTSNVSAILGVLRDIPNLGLPPTWLLGLVLLFYIVTIGPVNYLVLRAFDRRELAWITIPLLTLVFAGAIYGVGAATKGGSLIVSSVSVARVSPGARSAEVQAIYGLFTPSRGLRDVALPDGVLPSGFSENGLYDPSGLGDVVRFEQGSAPGVRQGAFIQWAQRSFAAQGSIDPAPLAVRAELRWNGTRLVGTITNTSTQTVEDGVLVYNNGYQRFGTLDPGASATVDWPTTTTTGGTSYGRGLGTVLYPGTGNGSNVGQGGTDEHRAALLDLLSGTVLDYRGRYYSGPTMPTPTRVPTRTPTPTARPGATPGAAQGATPTVPGTPTVGGAGATTATPQAIQILFWRNDAPLDLRIDAGRRYATTLIIQEAVPGAATQYVPAPAAQGEGN
jgi:hypothetical protein